MFEIVNRESGKGLTVKAVFEQRFEEDIRPNYAVKWEKLSRQRQGLVQRS